MTTATPRYDGLRLKKFDDAVFDDIDTLRSAIDDRIEQLLSANGQSDSLAKAIRSAGTSRRRTGSDDRRRRVRRATSTARRATGARAYRSVATRVRSRSAAR